MWEILHGRHTAGIIYQNQRTPTGGQTQRYSQECLDVTQYHRMPRGHTMDEAIIACWPRGKLCKYLTEAVKDTNVKLKAKLSTRETRQRGLAFFGGDSSKKNGIHKNAPCRKQFLTNAPSME